MKREAPFAGSNRFYRGRVVAALREPGSAAGVSIAKLGTLVREGFTGADEPWLFELVRGLERDGLALIAEDRADYNAGPIVRLPS